MNEEEKEEFWNDIGRPGQQKSAFYSFVVTVLNDGSVTTTSEPADEINRLNKTATSYDIYQACKEIVFDIENHLLADRVARLVVDRLQPKTAADEIKEKIINALNDRKQEAPLD